MLNNNSFIMNFELLKIEMYGQKNVVNQVANLTFSYYILMLYQNIYYTQFVLPLSFIFLFELFI